MVSFILFLITTKKFPVKKHKRAWRTIPFFSANCFGNIAGSAPVVTIIWHILAWLKRERKKKTTKRLSVKSSLGMHNLSQQKSNKKSHNKTKSPFQIKTRKESSNVTLITQGNAWNN